MTTPITVVCVDDHPLTLQAIVSELERDGAFKVAGIGHDGGLIRLATTLNPDVVFLDVGMPAKEGARKTISWRLRLSPKSSSAAPKSTSSYSVGRYTSRCCGARPMRM